MKRKFLARAAAAGLAVFVLPSLAASQATPPMGGGFTNVIPIPVDDPKTKVISGALFKPEGAGPFPAVIVMPTCAGVDLPPARERVRCPSLIDRPVYPRVMRTMGASRNVRNAASVPVLVLIGEKDSAAPCLALKGTPNFEVVVYPGAGHFFDAPGINDIGGHGMVYDENAAQDAERRADAFMAAHMPPK
jgi:dienelactone hydrolase